MLFQHIPGREAFKKRLIDSIKAGKIPHAQLFSGLPGSGSLALALAYIQYLYCQNPQEYDSCNQCPACSKISKLAHPDVHYVYPTATGAEGSDKSQGADAYLNLFRKFAGQAVYAHAEDWENMADLEKKKPIINVEEARKIINKLSLKSYEGGYKVMLIWHPEKMNVQAANALLKILEEPPLQTLFLLVSDDPNALLPTILSRVVRYEIPPANDAEVAQWLKELMPEIDADAAAQIAQVAGGNLREALRLAQEAEENYMIFFRDWMRACYKRSMKQIYEHLQTFQDLNREKQKACLLYGISKFRDAIMNKMGINTLVRASATDLEFSSRFSTVISVENALKLIEQFEKAHYHIERNANPKLVFMHLTYQSILLIG